MATRRKRKPTRKQLAALARGRAKRRRTIKRPKRRATKRRTTKRRTPKRRTAVKAHRRVRSTCKVCGHVHSRSQHRSHGTGSFRRTH